MERGMTADQVIAALWRRKLLLLAISAGIFAVGAATVLALPSVYEATTVVRVAPQRPGEVMVQRTVSELAEQQLLTARQQLLARPLLQGAIEELGLYPELVKERGMDAAVAAMRKDLTVRVEGESAFELTYRTTDPELAAQVANRLPQLFAEQTVRVRREHAQRATRLFADEVQTLKAALAEWERKIAAFKVAHVGELPEQLEQNMRALERVGALMQTRSEELRVAEERRSELARSSLRGDSEAGRLKAAEDGLTRELVTAQSAWTADHPEVERVRRELSAMRSERHAAEERMVVERHERARAAKLVEGIQDQIRALQREAEQFQQRLDNTPKWAHELGVLQSDYEITRTKYQSVVSRKVEAEIAEELEARSAATLFQVISPALVPVAPSRPDRMGGLTLAFLVALGVAVLTGVVLELRDDSIRDQAELRGRLPVPVLAVVPTMAGRTERRVLLPTHERNQVSVDAGQRLD
ncbi:MAG: Wzz/FepE/Etk N-terminal domain-containing protein [Myxococcaceae bacterium]|nr:Wzz/FepE/Etk N-terminal domain-containing protein [Myxococcaceae bacterium]MCI0673420.1 Wzz/FepE/Etk N-terminal domain-containing protein [Myxococcaceae bacterium]